jgi:hypothetical protein
METVPERSASRVLGGDGLRLFAENNRSGRD